MIEDKRSEEGQEDVVFDDIFDNNKIVSQLKTIYFFKIFRVALITLSGSYLFGLISWIIFDISYKAYNDPDTPNFIENYGLNNDTRYVKCVSVIYWVCTTFSTVGFGDFYP